MLAPDTDLGDRHKLVFVSVCFLSKMYISELELMAILAARHCGKLSELGLLVEYNALLPSGKTYKLV